MTKISWTEKTWNPVTGCTKISAGCKNCYAERMAKRLQKMGQPNYANGFEVTCHEHMLDIPARRKKPTMYFVCSMSDLFHADVPDEFIARVFGVMQDRQQHTFQVLTKRPGRMADFADHIKWPSNVWAGTSIEDQNAVSTLFRVSYLLKVNAPIRFLSCEPMIGPISINNLSLKRIQWVIVGGESGPCARPMNMSWAQDLRRQCDMLDVPFFFKQRGGTRKGDDWGLLGNEKVQEWPKLWEGKKHDK
jgi:protein gp37